MPRNTLDWTATARRDAGKKFRITEMPSWQAEKWALRAFMALARSGVDVPEDVQELGLAGLAQLGLKALAGASFEEAEPLLDEMMTCVKFVSSAGHERDLLPDEIEEVATRLQLRGEIFKLHTDFSEPVKA